MDKTFDWSLSLKKIDELYGRQQFKKSREEKVEKIRQQLGFPEEPAKVKNEFLVRLNKHNAEIFKKAVPPLKEKKSLLTGKKFPDQRSLKEFINKE